MQLPPWECGLFDRDNSSEKKGGGWIKVRGGEKSTRLGEGERWEVRKKEEEGRFKGPKKENCRLQVLVVCWGLVTKNKLRSIWFEYGLGGAAWGAVGQRVFSEPDSNTTDPCLTTFHISVYPHGIAACISLAMGILSVRQCRVEGASNPLPLSHSDFLIWLK